jgi:formylglycine-generating enzyme required for sulfatase activity
VSAQQPLQLRPGDVIAKKYEIDAALGAGPQGPSYAARAIAGGKKVVLKLLAGPASSSEQADDIVRRIRDVSSDSIVKITDTGEHLGRRWVVMDHVEGETLRRVMDEYAGQRKSFALSEAAQILAKVLEAADAAHRRGFVLRHLKPANILVQTRQVGPGKFVRTVKITGFGLSDMIHPGVLAEGLAERAQDGRYMAPELSSPSHGGTAQADLYSAGIVFYELLVGQTPMGTYLAPSRIREELPAHADNIVDIAIAPNAEDRYPTARDMINDLQRAFQDEELVNTGISVKTIAGIIGAVVVLVAAIGAYVAFDSGKAERTDKELRAQLVTENPMPSADEVKRKLVGREDMVYIPAGTFIQGAMHVEEATKSPNEALASVAKTEAYYIDRFEYPNQKGAAPLVNVTWDEAGRLCEEKGKRLCSAAEWERACKGPENSIYAYGNLYAADACGADVVGDADKNNQLDRASGELNTCGSGYGVFDLSGGAREWTADSGFTNKDVYRLSKGGKAGSPERASRCAFSEERKHDLTDRTTSFRCCVSEGVAPAGAGATPAAPADGAAPPPAP